MSVRRKDLSPVQQRAERAGAYEDPALYGEHGSIHDMLDAAGCHEDPALYDEHKGITSLVFAPLRKLFRRPAAAPPAAQ